ncbi:hypothetical protein DPMN_057339 [Dreissena polymorpha]|uniref:Uncharacterized protein n=1 Tax=Dreissena polymorpha TaxID=45954 RepID=A0A9D4HBT1_DREPO|nr:hypothetical protein DPMN_057339 [Dreissena polymorpha]
MTLLSTDDVRDSADEAAVSVPSTTAETSGATIVISETVTLLSKDDRHGSADDTAVSIPSTTAAASVEPVTVPDTAVKGDTPAAAFSTGLVVDALPEAGVTTAMRVALV